MRTIPAHSPAILVTVGFALATIGAAFAAAADQGQGLPPRPAPKHRRIIFNCDGWAVSVDAKGSAQKWIENVFAPLAGTQVDTLFWCDGAGGNTARYDSRVLELNGVRIGRPDPDIVKWIAQGNDPPQLIVREAKRRGLEVFYSFRINDIHDAFTPTEFSTYKEQHPEWMIGAQPYGYDTALNFAIPAVRAIKFAVIRELFRKYDFDGIEIDFMRSPPFFLPGSEERQAAVLTRFMRKVRRMLDDRARERGRAILIAARVGENLDACRLDGFDVPAWVREGLVDMLILGSGTIDADVASFKALPRSADLQVYPCLYAYPSKYNPIPVELARGIALSYWQQGADGIYTFNFFPHQKGGAWQIDLLREIGDPQTLHGKAMFFAADRGEPLREYPHNWLHAKLPATVAAGQAVTVPIMVGEPVAATPRRAITLRLLVEDIPTNSQFDFTLNGHALGAGARDQSYLVFPLTAEQMQLGRNELAVHVTSGMIVVSAAELHMEAAPAAQ